MRVAQADRRDQEGILDWRCCGEATRASRVNFKRLPIVTIPLALRCNLFVGGTMIAAGGTLFFLAGSGVGAIAYD